MSHKTLKKDSEQTKYVLGSPVYYDGAPADDLRLSINKMFSDVCLMASITPSDSDETTVINSFSRFIDCFFEDMKKQHSGSEVKDLAERCKARKNDLQAVSSLFCKEDHSSIMNYVNIFTEGKKNYYIPLSDLKYFPIHLAGVNVSNGDCCNAQVTLAQRPRYYIYLYQALFTIVKIISYNGGYSREESDLKYITVLLNLPVSLGCIFEKMNPDAEIMEEYAIDTINMLTTPCSKPSIQFWTLLHKVKNDLSEGKLPYIRSMAKALRIWRKNDQHISPFTKEDYYITLKSPAATIYDEEKKRYVRVKSAFSSIVEDNPLRSNKDVSRFTEFIHLDTEKSYLQEGQVRHLLNLSVKTWIIITKMIPNPSKYKPRAIHIGCNIVQDLCNWMHHRAAKLLKLITCDCTKEQHKGVKFLMRVSDPSYRKKNRNSIFVSDFSNATDTLNLEIQLAIFAIIWPRPVIKFWEVVSTAPKRIWLPNSKKWLDYNQITGQPQGLLCSFEGFTLVHHFLMLMLMKKSGFEKIPSDQFYRILGDDSVVSYPESTHDVSSTDPERYSDVYNIHTWLCKECNWKKNDAKTAKSFYNLEDNEYPDVILDFAKISIYEGKFISPVPVNLVMNYMHDPKVTRLAVPLWYAQHGIWLTDWVRHIVYEEFHKQSLHWLIISSIISSGEIEYLKGFKYDSGIPREVIGLSILAYGYAEMQNTILSSFLQEDKRDEKLFKQYSFESVWRGLVPKDIEDWLSIHEVDSTHKYLLMLFEESDFSDDIRDLFELSDPTLINLVDRLVRRKVDPENIHHMMDIRRYALEKPEDDEEDKKAEKLLSLNEIDYLYLFPDLKSWKQIQLRSLREKATFGSELMRSSLKEFRQLQECYPGIEDYIQDGLTNLSNCTYEMYEKLTQNVRC